MAERQEVEPAAEVVDGTIEHRLLVPILASETYDSETLAAFRERVDNAVQDAVACFQRRRELVAYPFDDLAEEEAIIATVRTIARWGARLALGMDRNPDRVAPLNQERRSS